MTKITSPPSNLSTPVYTAPPEPNATTSGAQAQEGPTSPRQSRRDNPSGALLRRLPKAVQNSLLTAVPGAIQVEIMDRMGKDSRDNLRLTCQDLEQVVSDHVQHVKVNNRESLEGAIAAYENGGITKLTLSEGSFTDDDLAHLQQMTSLQHLDLSFCTGLTGAGLAHLRQLTSLEHLDLSFCTGLSGASLAHLRQLTSLEHLDLSGCDNLRDDDLAHLQQMTSLKHLELILCTGLTDEGLTHLRPVTSLQHLDLSRCTGLTGTGLTHLRPLTSLQHLEMRMCTGLTDANLEHLGQIKSLQHLNLAGCRQLTDACFPHLQPLTSLQHLNLVGCNNLTMAGMELLRDPIGEDLVIMSRIEQA